MRTAEGQTILVAMLDADQKPIWTTLMRGTVHVSVDEDDYESITGDGLIMSSWSVARETVIEVRGTAVE